MNKRHLCASALLACALVLTACGASGDDTASSPSTAGSTSAESAKGNAADIAFLTGMKPHHEQAVEMSEMVLAADPPAEVAAIDQQIKGAQDPEIARMTTMLADLGRKPAGGKDHGSSMASGMAGHGGMMSGTEMAALMDASGTAAARLYLEGMVRRHQGAIQASDAELKGGTHAPARELAQRIEQAQTAEITTMQALPNAL